MRIHDGTFRRAVALPALTLAVGLVVSGCTSTGGGSERLPGPAPAGGMRLAAFDSCDAVLDDFRASAARALDESDGRRAEVMPDSAMPAVGGREAAAAPGAAPPDAAKTPGYSMTNTHEAGVDEPDLVKTDGRRVVSVADGRLVVVDVATRATAATLTMPGAPATGLFLHGDRALVILSGGTSGVARAVPPGGVPEQGSHTGPALEYDRSRVVLVDLSGGGARSLGELTVDGSYVDARRIGATARVVVRSRPAVMDGGWSSRGEALPALAKSTLRDWLPGYTLTAGGRTEEGVLTECDRVSRPLTEPGDPGHRGNSTLSVLSFDLTGELGKGEPVTIAADANTVYASPTSLYVATSYSHRVTDTDAVLRGDPGAWRGWEPRTAIHRFDLPAGSAPRHVASGDVAGDLLNQYSMSEHDGRLRVATTLTPPGGGLEAPRHTESAVTVLERDGDRLSAVGRVDGLGRGERIYAVRFLGTIGYVVTFRQTDPLYTLDLADPRAPRLLGELKINGYSAYLHPLADGSLLGVGQDATDTGMRLGTQVSLFDVRDLAAPRRVAQYGVEGGNSEAEFDPHAFLYRAADGTVVLPLRSSWSSRGGAQPGVTEPGIAEPGITEPGAGRPNVAPGEPSPTRGAHALVLRVRDQRIERVGEIAHPGESIRRSLVIGEELWTVSAGGIAVDRLTDLSRAAWIGTA